MTPKNATTTQSGRFYQWGDEKFWSVTTVLNAIAKPALVNWAAKEVATFAVANRDSWLNLDETSAIDLLKRSPYRNRTKAADLGSAVHAAVEAHQLGKPVTFADDVAPFMEQFELFVAHHKPTFEMAEASVYNRSQKYAGTLDMIAVIDGQRLLIDVKTGKAIYPEVALQLSAYAKAEFIGLPDGTEAAMPQVDGAAALHLRDDSWELVPVRIDDEVYRSFLYARETFRWLEEISKTVLGNARIA